MASFHKLRVTGLEKTIRDAMIVTLEPPEDADFSFAAGQYLTFRRDFDGEELRRSYSICSGLDDGVLQVGIKRVDGGAFSTWVNDEMRVGDVLEAMPPMGRFSIPEQTGASHYLGFAGGSGITPILSILRTVLGRQPDSRFTLVYANRGVSSIMFREELEDLKNAHMERLNIIHVLESDAQEIDLFTGRVTEEKCAELFQALISPRDVSTAFICGPEPMMLGIKRALLAQGLTEAQIKFELFASAQSGRAKRRAASSTNAGGQTGIDVQMTLDGAMRTFAMNDQMTLLEAALANNLDAPHACKAGVCSTCMCKILEGEVEMAANHALEDYEVARGYVLSCQAYPISKKIVAVYES